MMILARATRPPRAAQTEVTRAEQRFRNRIISLQHVSRARPKRIYDNVVSSFRHGDGDAPMLVSSQTTAGAFVSPADTGSTRRGCARVVAAQACWDLRQRSMNSATVSEIRVEQTRAFDIPAAVPEYVRPVARVHEPRAVSRRPHRSPVNDGVVE